MKRIKARIYLFFTLLSISVQLFSQSTDEGFKAHYYYSFSANDSASQDKFAELVADGLVKAQFDAVLLIRSNTEAYAKYYGGNSSVVYYVDSLDSYFDVDMSKSLVKKYPLNRGSVVPIDFDSLITNYSTDSVYFICNIPCTKVRFISGHSNYYEIFVAQNYKGYSPANFLLLFQKQSRERILFLGDIFIVKFVSKNEERTWSIELTSLCMARNCLDYPELPGYKATKKFQKHNKKWKDVEQIYEILEE